MSPFWYFLRYEEKWNYNITFVLCVDKLTCTMCYYVHFISPMYSCVLAACVDMWTCLSVFKDAKPTLCLDIICLDTSNFKITDRFCKNRILSELQPKFRLHYIQNSAARVLNPVWYHQPSLQTPPVLAPPQISLSYTCHSRLFGPFTPVCFPSLTPVSVQGQSFQCHNPTLWNVLPPHIRIVLTLDNAETPSFHISQDLSFL